MRPATTSIGPRASTRIPSIAGSTRIHSGRKASSSSGLVKDTAKGVPGRQSSGRYPHLASRTRNGPYVRKLHDCGTAVGSGPSAEKLPGAIVAVTSAS